MGIKWDPKISQVIRGNDPDNARTQAQKGSGKGVADMNAPDTPDSATQKIDISAFSTQTGLKSPSKATTQRISLQLKELARLRALLSGDSVLRQAGLAQAIQFAASYRMRRSKAERKEMLGLLEEILELEGAEAAEIAILRDILLAEGELHEIRSHNTWNAAALLIEHVDSESPHQALAQATLARTLTQLALHFPNELEEHEILIESALEQAFYLAEAASLSTSQPPDSHAALGRLLLIHGTDEATGDAEVLFRLALEQDPELDPARLGLAVCLSLQNRADESLAEVDVLVKKGVIFPGLWALRARLKADAGDYKTGLRDIERATKLAPEAGLYFLEAAKICELAEHTDQAESYREKGNALLGKFGPLAEANL